MARRKAKRRELIYCPPFTATIEELAEDAGLPVDVARREWAALQARGRVIALGPNTWQLVLRQGGYGK